MQNPGFIFPDFLFMYTIQQAAGEAFLHMVGTGRHMQKKLSVHLRFLWEDIAGFCTTLSKVDGILFQHVVGTLRHMLKK